MRMDNFEKISFIVLILLSVFLIGLIVNHREQLMQPVSRNKNPFRSNHVAKIHIIVNDKDWQKLITDTRSEQYVRADFWFDGEPYRNVAIRPKGMSSLMSGRENGRMPLKIDFNFFNFAQNFRGIKKLNLNNGFSDPTFIRETIGYELFEQMGLPTPRRAFADVWVNNTHLGLYTIVEQVDKTFLRRNFTNSEGNLYKPESMAAALNWTKADLGDEIVDMSRSSKSRQNNLDIKIGGARLGDLVKVLKREGVIGNEILPEDTVTLPPGQGLFPGGPRGQFPRDPNRPFPGRDPNRPFPGDFGGMRPGGPGGQFPGDPNRPFQGGFGGRFPGGEPNMPFPGGPGRRFPGDPNRPFARGGPFGAGGNLLEQMGLKTNENFPDHSALFRFLEVLNDCPDETFPSEIEKVLDVDQVLRFLAVSVMIVHLDNYIGMGHNYYLYEDNGKFTVVPWDLNMAFGTFGMGPVQGGAGKADLYIDEPTTGALADKPLVARLFAHKPYLDRYHQYLEQLLDGGFAEGVIEARIDEIIEMIRPYVEADELKFYSTAEFEKSINQDLDSGGWGGFSPGANRGRMQDRENDKSSGRRRRPGGGMNAPGLKSFIKQRRLSVQEQLDGTRPSRSEGGQNRGGFNMFERFGGNRGGRNDI
jgi:spore coat protein CotH